MIVDRSVVWVEMLPLDELVLSVVTMGLLEVVTTNAWGTHVRPGGRKVKPLLAAILTKRLEQNFLL
jgi:hypothetical protein